jgi:transposase
MKRKGMTQRQIARKLGISRNTVKKYIENQGYPERDRSKPNRKSLLDRFQGNIAAWLEEDMEYKATWIYDRLRPMGFSGSYEIVKRAVHDIKEERQRIAYMRFETEPGYQSQVDFGEFQFDRADGTIGKIYLFSMILGFSRRIYSEFVERCDLPTFLEVQRHLGGICIALRIQTASCSGLCRLGEGEGGETLSLHPGGVLAGLRIFLP